MTAESMRVDDTSLFVDVRGAADAPPLLFVHGGPGQGSYHFMHSQGDRLAERLRVIGVDQRGALRSDPLDQGHPLTVQTLVDDFEALRKALGVDSWAVLGHSAGGAYALDYAAGHPESVHAVIFDCPCWDGDLTDRHRLPVAADLFERYGDPGSAERCRALAGQRHRLTAGDDTRSVLQGLGDRYGELYFHRPEVSDEFDHVMDDSGLTDEEHRRGESHAPLLAEVYRPHLGLLPRLEQPSMLLHGRYDLVTPPAVIDRYLADAARPTVQVLEESGHFPSFEQPDDYAALVGDFVVAHAR